MAHCNWNGSNLMSTEAREFPWNVRLPQRRERVASRGRGCRWWAWGSRFGRWQEVGGGPRGRILNFWGFPCPKKYKKVGKSSPPGEGGAGPGFKFLVVLVVLAPWGPTMGPSRIYPICCFSQEVFRISRDS